MNGKEVRIGACLLAGNVAGLVEFYREVLGFNADWDGGDFAELETASGELSFFIYSREAFARSIGESYLPPRGINQTFETALWLPSYADVDAEYERLSKLDLRFPTGAPVTYPFGIRNFYIADPEGNLLEIGSRNKA